MELFPSSLLNIPKDVPSNFAVRPLQSDDYGKGFISVLGQLTKVGEYTEAMFLRRFKDMLKGNDTYFVVVVEDKSTRKIVGCASLIVELKFIRGAGHAGHIEDVVSDKNYRGKGIGKILIDCLVDLGRTLGCYKILLDCSKENVPFYEKCGMQVKEIQMVKYISKL